MIEKISFLLLFAFGLFLIWSSYMLFFNPEKVKKIIAMAGSTTFINYFELTIRLIVGIAFIFVSTKFDQVYSMIGYFLIISALILMIIPKKLHNGFSTKAAEKLKPIYLKIAAPFSLFGGLLLIYGIL